MSKKEIDANFVLLIISAIFCLIGAILMLVTSYAGYVNYYTYAIWADHYVFGPIIIIAAILLFICMGISIMGLIKMELLEKNRMLFALITATGALILNLIGIGLAFIWLFEVDWWPGAGMIGGTIASIIATVIFAIVWRINL